MSGIKKLFSRAEQAETLDPANEALIKSLETHKVLGAEQFESGPTLGEWTRSSLSFFFFIFAVAFCVAWHRCARVRDAWQCCRPVCFSDRAYDCS
jgi:hypothetical protein